MLCARRGGQLDGYLIMIQEETLEIGLIRAKIADMFVVSNDAEVIDALLAVAYESAREKRCHILELVGFPREIRALASVYRPFSRKFPNFPFFYKALSAELSSALQSENSWYPTLFDGDSSF